MIEETILVESQTSEIKKFLKKYRKFKVIVRMQDVVDTEMWYPGAPLRKDLLPVLGSHSTERLQLSAPLRTLSLLQKSNLPRLHPALSDFSSKGYKGLAISAQHGHSDKQYSPQRWAQALSSL